MVHFRGQFQGQPHGEGSAALPAWAPPPATIGQVFAGRYRIIHRLAAGRMGAVFRAEDLGSRAAVAIRILRPELSAEEGLITALQARIRRNLADERAAPGALSELVDLLDLGRTPEGQVFLVTPHIRGDDLEALLQRSGPVPWSQARGLFLRLCALLGRYHARGRVHGFLRARACWIVEGPAIQIVDDGLDALVAGASDPRIQGLLGPEFARYTAPEQASGEPLTPAVDLYALGVIFYELLTARVPFDDPSVNRTLAMHMLTPPPALREVAPHLEIPEAAEAVILRSLAKRPEDRFPAMEAMAAAISGLPTRTGGTAGVGAAEPAETPARPASPISVPVVRGRGGLTIPAAPTVPKVPGVGLAASVSTALKVPSVAVAASAPKVPGVAVAASAPKVPGVSLRSAAPTVPGVPTVPVVPGVPTVPAVPTVAPTVPAVPTVAPKVPAVAAAEAPRMVEDSTPPPSAGGAPEAASNLRGVVLPSLLQPAPEASPAPAGSIAAAVSASLRDAPEAVSGAASEVSGGIPGDMSIGTGVTGDSEEAGGSEGAGGSAVAALEEPAPEPESAVAGAGLESAADPAASSATLRRPSASASTRRIVDLQRPGASGSWHGRVHDGESHASSSGSFRGGAASSGPGASGSRRVVELRDVRTAGESAAQLSLGGGAAAAVVSDPLIDSDLGVRARESDATLDAAVADEETISGVGIRPGPSRSAIAWALGGIGALIAGSFALALFSPAERLGGDGRAGDELALASAGEGPSMAPPVLPRAAIPSEVEVEGAEEEDDEDDETDTADEDLEDEISAAPGTPKKRAKRLSRSKKKAKRKSTARAVSPEPEEEDDVLAQVEQYMRDKKEREASQAQAAAEAKAKAEANKSSGSPADQSAALDRLKQGREAYSSGKFAAAYSLASQSQSLSPSVDALELMGLASCAQRDVDRARYIHQKLAAGRRAKVEGRCREAGITL